MADERSFPLDEVLGYLIVRVAHVLEHGFTELMAEEGITVRQFGILVHAAQADGLGSAELARRLDVTPQSMGDQVETLCRRGLLQRDPDPGPGRRIGIHLTPEGRTVLGRAGALAGRYEEQTMGHLDPAQRTRLAGDLRDILARAAGGDAEPPPSARDR
jgi:DNA-binding MarR family transcriptional regulator